MEVRRLKSKLAASEAMINAKEEELKMILPQNRNEKTNAEERARKAERAEAEQRSRALERLDQIKLLQMKLTKAEKRAKSAENKLAIEHAKNEDIANTKEGTALENILNLIDEILEYAGLDATQEALKAERACARGPLSCILATNRPAALEKLIAAIESGDSKSFIREWNVAVPFLAFRKDRQLRELKLECAGLLAIAPLRTRKNTTAPYPGNSQEREALEIFRTVLTERPLDDDDTCKFLALPQLHTPWTRFQLELNDWEAYAKDAAIRLKERVQLNMSGVCWLQPPRLLILYDVYQKWNCELGNTCLRQQRRCQTLQKAAAELFVLLAWMLHDRQEQSSDKEEPFFFRQIRTRLAALKDVVMNDAININDSNIIQMPPPLNAVKLRQELVSGRGAGSDELIASILAALAARMNSSCNLLRVSTAQLLISTDALGLSDSFAVKILDPRKATPASTADLLLSAARSPRNFSNPEIVRRLYATLICRLAGRDDGRSYLLSAVQRPPPKISPLPEDNTLWPSPDLITVLLNEVASISDLAWLEDMDPTIAYAALTLQRLSIEITVARKLIYLGAVPTLLTVVQALLDNMENDKNKQVNHRSPLLAVFVAGTLLNVCATPDIAVIFSDFQTLNKDVATPKTRQIKSEHDRKYVLPLGWVAGANPVYFYCYATGESTWEAPADTSPHLCSDLSALILRVRKKFSNLDQCFKPVVHAATKHLLGALLCLGTHAARRARSIKMKASDSLSVDQLHFVQRLSKDVVHDLEQLEYTEHQASRSKSPVNRPNSAKRPKSATRSQSISPNKSEMKHSAFPIKKRSTSLSPSKYKNLDESIKTKSARKVVGFIDDERPKSANKALKSSSTRNLDDSSRPKSATNFELCASRRKSCKKNEDSSSKKLRKHSSMSPKKKRPSSIDDMETASVGSIDSISSTKVRKASRKASSMSPKKKRPSSIDDMESATFGSISSTKVRKASRKPSRKPSSARRMSRWEKDHDNERNSSLAFETRHVLDRLRTELSGKNQNHINTTVAPGSSVRSKTVVIEDLWPGADTYKKSSNLVSRFFPKDVEDDDEKEEEGVYNLETFLEPYYIQSTLK
uniref:WW domain-containing protein n=1 Tax=Aureoumbra lagunensis TaxID=44058 RepID=A0A7S3NLH6_9STRA